jgi:hypothetical protein
MSLYQDIIEALTGVIEALEQQDITSLIFVSGLAHYICAISSSKRWVTLDFSKSFATRRLSLYN